MPVVRSALFTVLLLAAVVLQTAFFPYFALDGATPNAVSYTHLTLPTN